VALNKKLLKYYLLLPLFFSRLNASSQDFIIQRLTVNDGLPSDRINCIYEDSYGYLWVGSSNGMGRYDGKNFTNYGFAEGLPYLQINAIFEDSRHRLWIGATKGIAQLRGNKFKSYKTNDGGEYTRTYGFYETDNKDLWALTNKGIYQLNDSVWEKNQPYNVQGYGPCKEIVPTSAGLVFNYGNVLVKKTNAGKWALIAESENRNDFNYFNSLQKNADRLYISVRDKLYSIVNDKLQLVIDNVTPGSGFNYFVDGDRCFVAVEGKGLYVYPLQAHNLPYSFTSYRSNLFFKIYKDRQGNMWMTSYEGLLKIQPKTFINYQHEIFRQPIKGIRNIISLYNDLLISSANSGFYILHDYSLRPVAVQPPTTYDPHDVVEGYSDDNAGGTWMMTRMRKFLYIKDGRISDYSYLIRRQTNEPFYDIAVHPFTDKVYLCTDSVLLIGDKNKMEVYKDADGKTLEKPISVVFTMNGIGVVNVLFKGIYFINKENRIVKAPPELDIIDERVSGWIYPGLFHWMWVRNSGRGLVCFRVNDSCQVKDVQQYTSAEGLPSNDVLDIATDREKRLWVCTSNGLGVMTYNKERDSWDVYNVGKQQGIIFDSWVDGRMGVDTLGNIWLSTTDNLVKIYPEKIPLNKERPRAVIEEIQLDMKETDWRSHTDSVYSYFQLPHNPVLKYNENSLGIRFNGTNLSEVSGRLYSYKLEPLDTAWNQETQNNFVSLLELAPGNYTFKVRTKNEETEWSEPASFSFVIERPFWNKWWFRILLIGLAASLIVFVYRRRVKIIKEEADMQNQMKELEMKALKAQMNPHFIYNALNSIQSLIADEKKSEAINYVGTFSRLLRQVLEHTDSNVVSLEKELHTLRLYIQLESLRLNIDLKYSLTTDESVMTEYEKVPPLILQPFVENSLWHGLSRREGEKILKIGVTQTDDYIVCTIEDNGIGRQKATGFKKSSSTEMYASRGIDITIKRLTEFNRTNKPPVVYEDLFDEMNNAAGTRVNVYIKKQ